MVPGRCLPADLWLLRGATTCTMFTICVMSWCDNSSTGSGTNCGCDAWNRAHAYLARNRSRWCKSGHSFSHSELGPHNEFTCTTRLLRSNLRTVGTSRWREHWAKSSITFHTGYHSAAPFLNVAFAQKEDLKSRDSRKRTWSLVTRCIRSMLHSLLCEPQLSWLKHPESMAPPRHPPRTHYQQHLHLSQNQWLLWNGGGSMFSMPVRHLE